MLEIVQKIYMRICELYYYVLLLGEVILCNILYLLHLYIQWRVFLSRMALQQNLDDSNKKLKAATDRIDTLSRNSSSGKESASTLNDEDANMLELALSMLRCSVCKDRFKEVAITRCYHLFCKECIDENLRNRLRKCPACGEKFGQDDVKSVFFTH
jgi:hypothetical protein